MVNYTNLVEKSNAAELQPAAAVVRGRQRHAGEGSNSEKQFSVRDCPFSFFPKHGSGHAVVEDSMDVVENRREFESQWSWGALRVATKAQNKS